MKTSLLPESWPPSCPGYFRVLVHALLICYLSSCSDDEKGDTIVRDGLDWVDRAAVFMGATGQDREQQLAELTSFNRAMKAIYDYWNPQDIFILKWWGIIGEEVDLEGM